MKSEKLKAIPKNATLGELYEPAMKVKTKKEAAAYLERLVEWAVRHHGQTREHALHIQKGNLGYFAGYYDAKTARRIWRLFEAAHPIFGTRYPTSTEAFEAGKKLAKKTHGESPRAP